MLKALDHSRLLLLRLALLYPTASRLEMSPGSDPSYRLPLLLQSGALGLGASLLIYLLASERTVCALCLAGLRSGSRWLERLYRLVVVGGVVAAAGLAQYELAHAFCALSWTEAVPEACRRRGSPMSPNAPQ